MTKSFRDLRAIVKDFKAKEPHSPKKRGRHYQGQGRGEENSGSQVARATHDLRRKFVSNYEKKRGPHGTPDRKRREPYSAE